MGQKLKKRMITVIEIPGWVPTEIKSENGHIWISQKPDDVIWLKLESLPLLIEELKKHLPDGK